MKIKINFYGVIRDVINEPKIEISLPDNSTVLDLLNVLAERYGPKFADRLLTKNKRLQPYVRLFINNTNVDFHQLDMDLGSKGESTAEATVYVLPASMGGH